MNFIIIFCFSSICWSKIVRPIAPKIINAIFPNNSSRIYAEAVYIPANPQINANAFICFGIENLESLELLENNNQAPINPNIMKTDDISNEALRSVAICSETEVTNGSCELRNGFNAFIYLKDIPAKTPDSASLPKEIIPIPEAIIAPNVKIEFLIL